MKSKGKWNKFKLVGSSSYQGSTVFGPYSLCTMTYLYPQFLKNCLTTIEPLQSPFNALIVIRKKALFGPAIVDLFYLLL